MANYASGANFERDVRKYYEAKDYYVIRSAGSKGAVDLIAFNEYGTILVQCKKQNRKKSYKEDLEKLDEVPCQRHWEKQLWIKRARKGYRVVCVPPRNGLKQADYEFELSFDEFKKAVETSST